MNNHYVITSVSQSYLWMFSHDINLSVLHRCVSNIWSTYLTQQQWRELQGSDELCFQLFVSAAVKRGHLLTWGKELLTGRPIHVWVIELWLYLDAELQVHKCVNVCIVNDVPAVEVVQPNRGSLWVMCAHITRGSSNDEATIEAVESLCRSPDQSVAPEEEDLVGGYLPTGRGQTWQDEVLRCIEQHRS